MHPANQSHSPSASGPLPLPGPSQYQPQMNQGVPQWQQQGVFPHQMHLTHNYTDVPLYPSNYLPQPTYAHALPSYDPFGWTYAHQEQQWQQTMQQAQMQLQQVQHITAYLPNTGMMAQPYHGPFRSAQPAQSHPMPYAQINVLPANRRPEGTATLTTSVAVSRGGTNANGGRAGPIIGGRQNQMRALANNRLIDANGHARREAVPMANVNVVLGNPINNVVGNGIIVNDAGAEHDEILREIEEMEQAEERACAAAMAEEERLRKEEDDEEKQSEGQRTKKFGDCTICSEEEVTVPVSCTHCTKFIGCSKCVKRWFRSSKNNDHHKIANCPLCRHSWIDLAAEVGKMELDMD